MNMKEFYEKYKLNKYEFASIARVGTRTLVKYANGEKIRESSRKRIELAIRVAEKYELIRPEFDYGRGLNDMLYRSKHCKDVLMYEDHFKELIKIEEEA